MEKTCPLRNDADPAHSAYHDCILVFGPDVPSAAVASAENASLERGFATETFRTAGLHSLEDLRLQLHAGGKLGPHTQAVLVFHGSRDAQGKHMLTLTSRGRQKGLVPTVETLRKLRRTDQEDTMADQKPTWGGAMHLITCEGGELDQEILPQDAAWQEGNYLIYAGRKRLLVHEGMRAITHLFDYLAQCRNQDIAPDPRQMLAYAAHRAGDGVTLLGASAQGAVVLEVPALTPENILQFQAGEWLKLQAHGGQEDRHALPDLKAEKEDAMAVLSAMSALADAPFAKQANLHEDKLKNVLLSAIGHQDADTVSLLLEARPDLAEARTLTGETAEELAWRDGNPLLIDAVLGARQAVLGARPLLLQASARGDHRTVLRLLTMAPEGAFGAEDLSLAMELAWGNMIRTYRFFEGLLEAVGSDENYLARQCLRMALGQETLPLDVATEWETWEEAHPQQRLDDARMFKVAGTDASRAPSALADACRQGDAILLDMLLQRFGLVSGSQADRLQLARLALDRENGGDLLGRLLDNALLHGDVTMFRATWRHAGGRAFIQKHGRLILGRACMGNQAGVARYLLRKVGMSRDTDASGDTLLHLAASGDSQEVLALLLTMKPALDCGNQAGDTALHVACRASHERIVQQLLTAGAATGIRNAIGETALDIAEAECLPDIVALLNRAPF